MKNNYETHREYMPIGLDPNKHFIRRIQAWGVAIVDAESHKGYKMVEGPFYNKQEALNIIGERGARIIHFMKNGGDRIIRFWHNNNWIKKQKII